MVCIFKYYQVERCICKERDQKDWWRPPPDALSPLQNKVVGIMGDTQSGGIAGGIDTCQKDDFTMEPSIDNFNATQESGEITYFHLHKVLDSVSSPPVSPFPSLKFGVLTPLIDQGRGLAHFSYSSNYNYQTVFCLYQND